ncbi:BamA/TamA family outer membrane protein [Anaeromyxobacter oryzae]|uniref:Bacterial surface antigen (D15) domain-containing protein n=1 Tax=Anaeromyxobacter oryzae TaxID=2918170 RepID=A0ABN6MVP7_9BACT|nr:hypothetical protein [Anaeromyxobacter oryzae]BDG05042.1 hypothetical protein AMOR_40380 [Anaeromyxobacter oryzae]
MAIFSRFGACGALLFAISASGADEPPADQQHAPDAVVVAPGAHYRAGSFFRFLFGGQWRDDWTTAIQVPELDLSTFDGGLAPVRRGGSHGLQTNSLRLNSANGHTWAFRSVDKDARKALDPELRGSIAGNLYRDITTTSQHPEGALVVASLLEAAGVLHATPQLFVMPDDPRLGEFRDFAGVLGVMELHAGRGFAGSDKALGTLELFARMDQRTDERVDARAYLRARLMDVLIGDWDRHWNQWRWLRFEENGERVWRPVPRDRDEAFSRFDGILPSIGEYYTKFLVSFHEDYPSIDKLTFGGRYIDRRFLVGLEPSDWRAVTSDVVARLTDETIATAVRRLPPEIYARDGAKLERALRARRDALPKESDAFYRLLAEDVDVYGSEGADLATIHRARDGGVDLTLSARNEDTGEALGPHYFHRAFRAGETSEIRLYLLGGADRVVEEGERGGPIRVRIVRGGPDPAANQNAAANVQPTKTDTPDAVQVADPPGDDQERLIRRYEHPRDWGTDWLVYPQLSYDGTRGLVAGARLERTQFGFAREPFANQMNFAAAWSTGLAQPRLEYRLDLRTQSRLGVVAYLAYSGMDFANFFGFGNTTARSASLDSHHFYRVDQQRFVVRPLVTASLVGPLRARAGFALQRFSNTPHDPGSPASGAYGSGTMSLADAEAGLDLDTRSGVLTRRRGLLADLSVRYFPPWLDNASAFTKLRGEAVAVFGSPIASPVLLSLRVAGEKNWGRYPFFEAASIGGIAVTSPLSLSGGATGNLLRGYDLNRFAGDASIVGNLDVFVPLGRYSAIVPLRYGLQGIADVGRVFLAGESSHRWHPGAGGGLWLALRAAGAGMDYSTAISASVVHSDEGTSFYLTSAFNF